MFVYTRNRGVRNNDDDVDKDYGNIIKYESQFMTSQKILVGISMGEKTNKCDDNIFIHSLIIDEFIDRSALGRIKSMKIQCIKFKT